MGIIVFTWLFASFQLISELETPAIWPVASQPLCMKLDMAYSRVFQQLEYCVDSVEEINLFVRLAAEKRHYHYPLTNPTLSRHLTLQKEVIITTSYLCPTGTQPYFSPNCNHGKHKCGFPAKTLSFPHDSTSVVCKIHSNSTAYDMLVNLKKHSQKSSYILRQGVSIASQGLGRSRAWMWHLLQAATAVDDLTPFEESLCLYPFPWTGTCARAASCQYQNPRASLDWWD